MKTIGSKILTILIVVFLSNLLLAQQLSTSDDTKRQMDRLREKIQEARSFSNLFPNRQLGEIIQSAQKQLSLAQDAYSRRQYSRAASYIKMGFFYLDQLYRELKNNPFIRNKFKDVLDEKIQQAEQIVIATQNPEAKKLLNRARFFRQRAFRLAALSQSEAALKNYFLAIFFAEKTIRTAKNTLENNLEHLEKQFEESKTLLEETREMVASTRNQSVKDLLVKAETELQSAQRFFKSNQALQAAQRLEIANRLLFRILDQIEKNSVSQHTRLLADLQSLEENIVEFRGAVDDISAPDIKRLLERLSFLSASIRQNYESQNFAKARDQLSIANRLLLQLNRRLNASTKPDESRIQNQLETAEIMLESVEENLVENKNLTSLIDLLKTNLDLAKTAFQNNQNRIALQHLQIFNNLALKLVQLKNIGQATSSTDLLVQENLNRLDELLKNPPQDIQTNDITRLKYENAKKLYDFAKNAYDNKNFAVCWQITRLALNILTQ